MDSAYADELLFSLCCVCVSAVRLCVGPLSLCLLYAFAGIQIEQSVSQSPASLSPAHVRTFFVQQYQQAMRITGM
jgi:hypothetical protein